MTRAGDSLEIPGNPNASFGCSLWAPRRGEFTKVNSEGEGEIWLFCRKWPEVGAGREKYSPPFRKERWIEQILVATLIEFM